MKNSMEVLVVKSLAFFSLVASSGVVWVGYQVRTSTFGQTYAAPKPTKLSILLRLTNFLKRDVADVLRSGTQQFHKPPSDVLVVSTFLYVTQAATSSLSVDLSLYHTARSLN